MDRGDAKTQPLELELKRASHLRIKWADGHESVYPLSLLRRRCPCATCRAEREDEKRKPLQAMDVPEAPQDQAIAEHAELVGNYGVRISWKDGHDTGIYDYGLLRSLCPCEACAGGKAG
jgi:DUF971 family protein